MRRLESFKCHKLQKMRVSSENSNISKHEQKHKKNTNEGTFGMFQLDSCLLGNIFIIVIVSWAALALKWASTLIHDVHVGLHRARDLRYKALPFLS